MDGDSGRETEIDAAMAKWSQGDMALSEGWFVHAGHIAVDESEPGEAALQPEPSAIVTEVIGLVLVSQTCDIVRSCAHRPFVEVAPLVELIGNGMDEARRGRRPQYFVAPSGPLSTRAVDLDRSMTVEKEVVARWARTPSGLNDAGLRGLQAALARKRARFAFPDDFTALVGAFQNRLVQKHDRRSEEGNALRALREIRVQATPHWGADRVELLFWLLREDTEEQDVGIALDALQRLVQPTGRFVEVYGQVATLDEMTARDYVESDRLDLDHLSTRSDE